MPMKKFLFLILGVAAAPADANVFFDTCPSRVLPDLTQAGPVAPWSEIAKPSATSGFRFRVAHFHCDIGPTSGPINLRDPRRGIAVVELMPDRSFPEAPRVCMQDFRLAVGDAGTPRRVAFHVSGADHFNGLCGRVYAPMRVHLTYGFEEGIPIAWRETRSLPGFPTPAPVAPGLRLDYLGDVAGQPRSASHAPAPLSFVPGIAAAYTGDQTGLLSDPDRSGQGVFLALERASIWSDQLVGFVAWFTYDHQRRPRWLVTNTLVNTVQSLRGLPVIAPFGGGFGPNFDPDAVQRPVLGSFGLGNYSVFAHVNIGASGPNGSSLFPTPGDNPNLAGLFATTLVGFHEAERTRPRPGSGFFQDFATWRWIE